MASKALQSTIEIAGVLSPTLQAAISGAVDRLEEMSAETLAAAGAAEKLCAEIGTQEEVLKALQKGYADYVVAGEESSDEAQTLAAKIQELSDELDSNRGAIAAAEKAAKKLTDSQEDVGDAYTQLEKKINSQESELEALKRQYANVALEQGETSDEAQRLATKINDLSGELNENKQKLRAAEQAADGLADALDQAAESAENSGEGFTVLKGAIADLAADAIAAAIEGFKELALEGDAALAKLEARTGATGDKMEGFEDVMYEVYNANYGENLTDVSEALSTVIQMTDDLDNASLAQVTKNTLALKDVFGFDVTESMRAANSLMDKFGITSDQAFNLIVQGAQKGLNQNDDLLDTINEYSVQFSDAGYSADDMFNMLANGAETGTWSVDKLGDAVKEFNIRMSDGTANEWLEQLGVDADSVVAKFNKGGPEAQAAIGTVMDAIMSCDDATLQYQAGVGIFGTMWEDLGADTVASLMTTEGAINSTNEAMKQMDAAAYDSLEASLSQLGRTIKGEVLQPIVNLLTPAIKAVVDFCNDNLPTIGVVLAGIAAAMVAFKWGSIVSGIMGAVSAVQAFGAALLANPITLWIVGITAVVAALTYLWNNCEGFRNFFIGLWDGIKNAVSAAGEWISSAWSACTSALSAGLSWVSEKFVSIWSSVTSFLSSAWSTIKNVVQVGIMFIGQLLSAAFQIITLPFRFIWENCKGVIISVWNAIKSAVSTAINAVRSVITSVMNIIRSVISTIWNAISSKIAAVINAVKGVISAAWNAIKSVTSSVWNGIKSAISGVWNGIKSGVSSAVNTVKSTVSGVWNSIKSVTSSVWNSIKTAITKPINAAKDAVKTAIDKIKSFFNFEWKLPHLKLPHFNISGKFSLDPPSVPKFSIDWYKDGGIMTQPTIFGAMGSKLLAGGEAGAEAILPLSVLWDKMETILRRILDTDTAGETSGAGLISKAGELLTLDDFSLGSLANSTNVYIYYDFSHFTWSPQIRTDGTDENEDDLMARLKAHEAEFFEWLEEFIEMREVAQYA